MRRLVGLLIVLGCVFGCTKGAPESLITRRLESDVLSLNPLRLKTVGDVQVAHLLYTPLLYLDGKGNIQAGLATRWIVSPDRLEYTFHLDPRATFSDGSRVTSQDVLYTLKSVVSPEVESRLIRRFDRIDLSRTTTPDARTIVVRFREALAPQLTNFASLYVVPARSNAHEKDALLTTALGSGPYVLERRDIGTSITLRRRENYWREPARIDRIRFNIISDNQTAWNALLQGTLDESIVTSDTWRRERNAPAAEHLEFIRFFDLGYNFVAWNCSREGLSDVRVRRALAQAVDVPSIISHLYEGTGRPLNGHFVPNTWASSRDVPLVRYDPAAARKTLESLGWTAAKPLTIDLLIPSGSRTTSAVAEVIERGLREVGVAVTITQLDGAAYFDRILAGNFDAAYLAWSLDIDPDPYGLFHSGSIPPHGRNYGHFQSAEVDRLIDEGRSAPTRAQRQQIYHRLHRQLADEQPYLWILQPATVWAFNERVKNVKTADSLGLFLWYPADQAWTIEPAAR